MPKCKCFVLMVYVSILSLPELVSADQTLVLPELETLRAHRLANATEVLLSSPYLPNPATGDFSLFVLNKFAYAIDVELIAHSEDGQSTALGNFVIEPTLHLEIPLNESLSATSNREWLSLRYLGDAEMVQAWLVVQGGAKDLSWELKDVSKSLSNLLVSSWDLRHAKSRDSNVVYHISNPNREVALFEVFSYNGAGVLETHQLYALNSHNSMQLQMTGDLKRRGSIQIVIEGDSRVSVFGRFEVGGLESTLPVASIGDVTCPCSFDSLPLEISEKSDKNLSIPWLWMYNPSAKILPFEVQILDSKSGRVLRKFSRMLEPNHVENGSWMTPAILRVFKSVNEARFRIASHDGSLQVHGFMNPSKEGLKTIPIFSTTSAHQNDQYPVPDLDRYSVTSTMVNLGTKPARIAMQLFWKGGTYSLLPFEIPGGVSRKIYLSDLIQHAQPDLLARMPPSDLENGTLQWSAQRGSYSIISRIDVAEKVTGGNFGFNCNNCCPEVSIGEIIPNSVIFDIGQTTSFQGVEFIATCNSTLGPFPADFLSLSYASPISWNGGQISASGWTRQTLSFSANGERTRFTVDSCYQIPSTIFASGGTIVDSCLEEHAPGYDPKPSKGGCKGQSSTCNACLTCCDNVRQATICSCNRIGSPCTAQSRLACMSCKSACFTGFDVSTCTNSTSCN